VTITAVGQPMGGCSIGRAASRLTAALVLAALFGLALALRARRG
jgi:hypothetical protein